MYITYRVEFESDTRIELGWILLIYQAYFLVLKSNEVSGGES